MVRCACLLLYSCQVWQSVVVHLHCNDINEVTSYSVKLTPVQLNERGATEETHLQTRGLPALATRAQGLAILHKLSCLSAEFGTTIKVEDSIEGDSNSPVIGWVLGSGGSNGFGSHSISLAEKMAEGASIIAQAEEAKEWECATIENQQVATSEQSTMPYAAAIADDNLLPPALALKPTRILSPQAADSLSIEA